MTLRKANAGKKRSISLYATNIMSVVVVLLLPIPLCVPVNATDLGYRLDLPTLDKKTTSAPSPTSKNYSSTQSIQTYTQIAETMSEDSSFSNLLSLIPIPRINGYAAYHLTTAQNSGQNRTFRNRLAGGANLSTYVWFPWFLTVTGNLDAVQNLTSSGSDNASSTNASGGIKLNFLPLSRYPVSVGYRHSDSRSKSTTDTSSSENGTVSDYLNFKAGYQWDTSLDFDYSNSYIQTENIGQSESVSIYNSFGVDKLYKDHRLNLQTNVSNFSYEDINPDNNNETMSTTAALRHRYTPWENVTYHNISSITFSTSDSKYVASELASLQGTSSLSWTPKDYPITLSGVSRTVASIETSTDNTPGTSAGSTDLTETALNGQLGLNYRYSPKLNFTATGTGLYSATESTSSSDTNTPMQSQLTMSGTGGVNYQGDQRKIYNWNWYWGSGGNATVSSTTTGITHAQSINGNQSFSRDFMLPYINRLQVTGNQSVAGTKSVDAPIESTATHSLRLSENDSTESRWSSSSLTFSDRRTITGANPTSNQLVNIQVNNKFTLTRTSQVSASLSAQGSKKTTSEGSSPWETYSSGNISYNASNLMKVPNLSLNSTLTFSSNSLIPISTQSPSSSPQETVTWSRDWSLGLYYSLGQLQTNLVLRLKEDQSTPMSNLLQFMIKRNF